MRSRLTGGNRAIVAARSPGADRNVDVEPGRCPRRVALVASRAVGACRNVVGTLAGRLCTIVTACTIGGRCEGAVISLGTGPDGCRFVTTFTTRRGGQVQCCFAGRRSAIVATRTPGADRNVDVELGRRPGGVALVAGSATGSC